MNMTAIIQARLDSERLPLKVMMDVCGKTMLERVIDRTKMAVDNVIVVTPDLSISKFVTDYGISFSMDRKDRDVLDSYYWCAMQYEIDDIIRITADNPLLDPLLLKEMIKVYASSHVDYLSNNLPQTYPVGLDIEIFKFEALEKAHYEAKTTYEREHVTPYIRNHLELFKLRNVENDVDLSELRWTVDYPEDLEFVREIYSKLGGNFTMNDVLEYIKGGVIA